MIRSSRLLAGVALLALLGAAPHPHASATGSFTLTPSHGPFISGAQVPIRPTGLTGAPISLSLLGPGRVENGQFVAPLVPRATTVTLLGAAPGAIACDTLRVVPAPPPRRALIAVATYQDGIALHDPKTFSLIGYLPIGGSPGDVAFAPDGSILSPDTDGDTLTRVGRAPWRVQRIGGVASGNEVAVDSSSGDTFVTDRDADGSGALTRISRSGEVRRVKTGDTAEGLAIDTAHGRVYVGNVNARSVTVVDARSMRVVTRIASVERTFGLALDDGARHLFVVSNASPSMSARGGYVATIDLRLRHPRITRRSARMNFPLGVAVDDPHRRLFVTDEAQNVVYVLNAKTLNAAHAPLQTCKTPWRPRIARGRLYVPCASSNTVDVFDLGTLRRVRGAPFVTGGFPLGVALWP